MMQEVLQSILQEDIDIIIEELTEADTYNFSGDLSHRLGELSMSDVMFATRCGTSHTTIQKWRTGKALPMGREKYKELALAFGMTEEDDHREVSRFLLKNGFYSLNVKNPLDNICQITLLRHKGEEDIVLKYREYITQYGFDHYVTKNVSKNDLKTSVMSSGLSQAIHQNEFTMWLSENTGNFSMDKKKQDFYAFLDIWVNCFLGDHKKPHSLYVLRSLSLTLRDLLYTLDLNKRIEAKKLQEKIMALGVYLNMTVDEMDLLLDNARQQKLSESESRFCMAVRSAVQCAHLRYPYYEYENCKTVISNIEAMLESDIDDEVKAVLSVILQEYAEKLPGLEAVADYYEDNKDIYDEVFEEAYTGMSDKGMMDYIYDVISLLKEKGVLSNLETDFFLKLMKRDEPEE